MGRVHDDYITISEAAESTPKPTAVGTIWNWIRSGVSIGGYRVRLRTMRQGHSTFTRKAWLTAFIESCNDSEPTKHDVICEPAAIPKAKPGRRKRENRSAAHRRAEEACRKAGV